MARRRVSEVFAVLLIGGMMLLVYQYGDKSSAQFEMRDFTYLQNRAGTFQEQAVLGPNTGKEAKQVLLLTYMRSGSSLTGDILQHSPGAFYIYEPFRSLGHKNESSYILNYANGTKRLPPLEFNSEAAEELYNWFTCDIPKLPNIALLDMFMNKGMKSAMMTDCYRDAVKKVRDSSTALLLCAKQLRSVCLNSPFRIIKTIRLELSTVSYLLDRLPNLQIIHLVRDPRATLSSQARLGMCKQSKGGQQGCTERFCKRLENDVLQEENILRKHQGRIMPVFYEDIAREPIQTSKKMYDFIGAEFTQSAEQYIFNITMAGLENDCAICTTRSNSTEHIDSWKTRMKLEFKTIVQARCNYILRRYGYTIYTKDELINMAKTTK